MNQHCVGSQIRNGEGSSLQHGSLQIAFRKMAELFHTFVFPIRRNKVGGEHNLFQKGHVGFACCVPAHSAENLRIGYAAFFFQVGSTQYGMPNLAAAAFRFRKYYSKALHHLQLFLRGNLFRDVMQNPGELRFFRICAESHRQADRFLCHTKRVMISFIRKHGADERFCLRCRHANASFSQNLYASSVIR